MPKEKSEGGSVTPSRLAKDSTELVRWQYRADVECSLARDISNEPEEVTILVSRADIIPEALKDKDSEYYKYVPARFTKAAERLREQAQSHQVSAEATASLSANADPNGILPDLVISPNDGLSALPTILCASEELTNLQQRKVIHGEEPREASLRAPVDTILRYLFQDSDGEGYLELESASVMPKAAGVSGCSLDVAWYCHDRDYRSRLRGMRPGDFDAIIENTSTKPVVGLAPLSLLEFMGEHKRDENQDLRRAQLQVGLTTAHRQRAALGLDHIIYGMYCQTGVATLFWSRRMPDGVIKIAPARDYDLSNALQAIQFYQFVSVVKAQGLLRKLKLKQLEKDEILKSCKAHPWRITFMLPPQPPSTSPMRINKRLRSEAENPTREASSEAQSETSGPKIKRPKQVAGRGAGGGNHRGGGGAGAGGGGGSSGGRGGGHREGRDEGDSDGQGDGEDSGEVQDSGESGEAEGGGAIDGASAGGDKIDEQSSSAGEENSGRIGAPYQIHKIKWECAEDVVILWDSPPIPVDGEPGDSTYFDNEKPVSLHLLDLATFS